MTDHYAAMITALKEATRQSRKSVRKCNEALAEMTKACTALDKVKQNHKEASDQLLAIDSFVKDVTKIFDKAMKGEL